MIDRPLRFDANVRQHGDADVSLQAYLTDRFIWQDNRFAAMNNYMTMSGGNSVVRGKANTDRERAYLRSKWGKHVEFGLGAYAKLR